MSKADYRTSSQDLFAEYAANTRSADLKYDRKWVEVTGEVYRVDESSGVVGGPHVEFLSRGSGCVKCVFDEKKDVKPFRLSNKAVILGRCAGIVRDNGKDVIVLRKCACIDDGVD